MTRASLVMSCAGHGERLMDLYHAFNDRDLTRVLDAMATDVDWPNGWEGGRLLGHAEVRSYWERQWAQIRLRMHPTAVVSRPDGRVEVRVRQVVRDPFGAVLDRRDVCHIHTFRDHLVQRMDVEAS